MSAHQYYKKRMTEDCGLIGVCMIALAAISFAMQHLNGVWMP